MILKLKKDHDRHIDELKVRLENLFRFRFLPGLEYLKPKRSPGYYPHDFYLVEIQQLFGPEIEKAFGKNLARLRKKYGR